MNKLIFFGAAFAILATSSGQQPSPVLPPAGPGVLDVAPAGPGLLDPSPGNPINAGARDEVERFIGRAGGVMATPNQPETFDFQDQPLGNVFRLLAAKAGINYIAPPIKTEERITLHLERMKPMEALREIASQRGFELVESGRSVTLRRPDIPAPSFTTLQTYRAHHLPVETVFQGVANVLGIKLAQPQPQSPAYPAVQATVGGATNAVSGVAPDSQARPRFTPGLPFDEGFIKGEGQTAISLSRRMNAILVRATPGEHSLVSQYLAAYDVYVPQIEIKTYVIEVDVSDNQLTGFDWSSTLGESGITLGIKPVASGTAVTTAHAFFNQGAIITASQISVVIRALRNGGKVSNLSSPIVVTQAGVPTAINAYDKDTIAITQPVSVGNTTSTSATLQSFTTGLTLDVLPRILGNGRIALNLRPQLSSKIGDKATPIGDIPIINERGTVSEVIVPDGHAVVLGGIVRTVNDQGENMVPFLGKIPVLGTFFRSKKSERRRTNLIFMVQARTLRETDPMRARLGIDEAGALESVADLTGEPPIRRAVQVPARATVVERRPDTSKAGKPKKP